MSVSALLPMLNAAGEIAVLLATLNVQVCTSNEF